MGLDALPTTRADRRPQRARLGARRAAPLARGRAQVAAPLPEGVRGRHRLRRRRGRSGACCARRSVADPPGRRRARTGRPAGGGDRAARERDRGAARHRQAADADARAGRRPRARVVRAARLPGAAARPASRCRRCRCSRSTARCRRRSRPIACIRPTCGPSTGAGATSPTTPTSSARQADATVARRARRPAALADARHADAHRGGEDERALRRPRRRLDASAGAHVLEARRGDVRGAAARPARLRRLHQARRLAPAGAVPHPRARRLRRLRAARAGPAVLLRAVRAAPGRGIRVPRLAVVREAYGFVEQTPTDYSHSVLGRFDPAIVAHAQEARRRGEGGLVGDGRRRDAPPRRPVRAVRAGRRFAAAPVPVGETFAAELQTAVQQTQAAQAAPPRAAGDGGGDQPALPRGRARGRRLRPSRARRARQASRRAARAGRARSSRPSRSSRGWRSSTGASPTARRWAASCRSCAPRSPRSRSRSTSSSATPTTARC